MKALIERRLYQPAIVLPMLMLVGLMTALDFSPLQIALALAFRGSRYIFKRVARREAELNALENTSHDKTERKSQALTLVSQGKPDLKALAAVSLSKPALKVPTLTPRGKAENCCHC